MCKSRHECWSHCSWLTAAGTSALKPSFVVPVEDFVQDSVHLHFKTSCTCPPAGSSALGLLLGPEGDFVREMLIEELAKGVDAALRTTLDDAIAGTRQRLTQLLGVSGVDGVCCSGRIVGNSIPWLCGMMPCQARSGAQCSSWG